MDNNISEAVVKTLESLQGSTIKKALIDIIERKATIEFLLDSEKMVTILLFDVAHISFTEKAFTQTGFLVNDVSLQVIEQDFTTVLDYTIHYTLSYFNKIYFGFATSLQNRSNCFYHLHIDGDQYFDIVFLFYTFL